MAKKFDRHRWLINQLRRLSMKYPPAINATNRTKETYYIPSKTGKQLKRVKFTCAMCGAKDKKRSEMSLDHRVPVIDYDGFSNFTDFINGLFCDEDNLWLICQSPCHDEKTKLENLQRGPNFRKKK